MKNRPHFISLVLVTCLFFVLLTTISTNLIAGGIGTVGGGSVGEPGCDPFDEACPIDGGLSLLIAAGIGLGARKVYQRKKQVGQA